MFNRLSNAPNRSILYDLYNYICDIKTGVGLARAYVKGLGEERQENTPVPCFSLALVSPNNRKLKLKHQLQKILPDRRLAEQV